MSYEWTIVDLINILLILSIVFFDRKKPGEAVIWIVVLSALPVFGIILYFVFGSTIGIKLTYMVRARKLEDEGRKVAMQQLSEVKGKNLSSLLPQMETCAEIARFNLDYSESIVTKYNGVEVFTDGIHKYERLFEDIRQSQKSIHMVYYGFHRDGVGKRLVKLLAEKAGVGVTVRVMYDGVGSLGTPRAFFRELIKKGGNVKKIKPFITHFRNHRKIVVIDGKIGYLGGMNIGEQYAGRHRVKTPWRDTHIRLVGEAVNTLQYWFLYDWLYANKPQKTGISEREIPSLFSEEKPGRILSCQIIGSGVDTDLQCIKMNYLKLITTAKKRILMQSPYFIPDVSILNALKMAAASGVEVWIMRPKVKASFFLQPVSDYYLSQVMPHGVHVLEYAGYLHAKTMVIDGIAACIGSANMDIRSLEVDDEICAVFYDEKFTRQYEDIFWKDREACTELDAGVFARRGWWRKAKERFFHLFAPLM